MSRPTPIGTIDFLALLPAAFTMLTFMGCPAVGPDYVKPATSVSAAWNTELQGGLSAGQPDRQTLARWWTTLNDPVLSSLIERAVVGNLDLQEARARVREARARRGISKAALFPTIDAGGSASVRRSSEERGRGTEEDLYEIGFDAGWELDLFGGTRRSIEGAEADLQASRENLRDVLVSLLAEVALNYVDVRTFQTRLSVATANLDAQTDTYNISTWRLEAGLTTQLDVEQARYSMEQTRAQIPTLRTGLEQAKNGLAVLLGEQPGALHPELEGSRPVPVTPLEVAVGIPADVLRRRPDVRQAERELAAQTARVGVATADLYPKFSLPGSIGLEALSPDNLFSAGSRTYLAGPAVTWRIFDAGAIRSNIDVQTALQEQALIRYESAVLTALEDVENMLVAYADEQVRRRSLVDATEAAQRAVDLARDQYSSGLIDFQNVLVAQRSLLVLQEELAVSDSRVTSNLISLYKALGGGWTSLASAGAAAHAKQ